MVKTLILAAYLMIAANTVAEEMPLRQQVFQSLENLKSLESKARKQGIETSREQVTITTAELFLKYAQWDAEHEEELAKALNGWWQLKGRGTQMAKEMPGQELRDTLQIVREAMAELQMVLLKPSARKACPEIDHAGLTESGGYLQCNGRPVFNSSFVWMPKDSNLWNAYGGIDGKYLSIAQLKSPQGEVNRHTLEKYQQDNDHALGYVFFGHSSAPAWARKTYPDILVGARHFTKYDIDRPLTRDMWRTLLNIAGPHIAGKKVSQGGYLLANEPHWFTAANSWDSGPVSNLTIDKFRRWLEQRHGKIDELNRLWEADFKSFDAVAIEVPLQNSLQGTALWYDWCRFNMDRVTDWFDFLKSEVRTHDPAGKVHIKLIPTHFSGINRDHGLDFEALVRLQDILGCDAKITTTVQKTKNPRPWPEHYSCVWRDMVLPYDFFKSVCPDKLLFDSEFHGLSTVHWREFDMSPDYVRCIYWLAHLHGMGMNQTWYWGRDADGSPKGSAQEGSAGFAGSLLTQPKMLNIFGRTMKELNAVAPEVIRLATQPKPVRIFYSETAAIQEADYMDRVFDTYRSLYHSGLPLGFVTEGLLNEHFEDAPWAAVVIPPNRHVTRGELAALQTYLHHGGTVVMTDGAALDLDAYGRKHEFSLGPKDGQVLTIQPAGLRKTLCPVLAAAGAVPKLIVAETNPAGVPGCVWRACPWKGGQLLIVINLGKTDAQLHIDRRWNKIKAVRDVLTDRQESPEFILKTYGVRLLHIK
ncbi:MAG: beta-galactosidase [Kiritimatiellales bacterium]|nr:beta-galactosidase [Kiritimatiellales bacterium]